MRDRRTERPQSAPEAVLAPQEVVRTGRAPGQQVVDALDLVLAPQLDLKPLIEPEVHLELLAARDPDASEALEPLDPSGRALDEQALELGAVRHRGVGHDNVAQRLERADARRERAVERAARRHPRRPHAGRDDRVAEHVAVEDGDRSVEARAQVEPSERAARVGAREVRLETAARAAILAERQHANPATSRRRTECAARTNARCVIDDRNRDDALR